MEVCLIGNLFISCWLCDACCSYINSCKCNWTIWRCNH